LHLNTRASFSWLLPLVATPNTHRIHHSDRPEHRDKNFAAYCPLWDILFGTYCPPVPGDHPATGLTSGERETSVTYAAVRPFQIWARMIRDHYPSLCRFQCDPRRV